MKPRLPLNLPNAGQVLVPILGPTDIVVIDNLSVHRNAAAVAAIEAAGAQIWHLPPYSPDLNPVEKVWSNIEAFLRKAQPRDPESLFEAIGYALEENATGHRKLVSLMRLQFNSKCSRHLNA
jgi:transposase